jgi:RNA polymerase sigma-70 factor (ECF subfamily)
MDSLFREIVVFYRQLVTAPPFVSAYLPLQRQKGYLGCILCSPVTTIGYTATVLIEGFPLGKEHQHYGQSVDKVASMVSWRRVAESNGPDRRPAFRRQLDGARCGESEALSTLYRQFLPAVSGYVATRVPDRATAEDLTSEVFLKMVEGIGQLQASDEPGFAAWLLQIARFTVADYYRKRQYQPMVVSLEPTGGEEDSHGECRALPSNQPDGDPAHWIEAREEWARVVAAINTLTEEQRQVLVGRLIIGFDVATVARMVGKKANAVKSLQFRALQSLHHVLSNQQVPERALHHVHGRDKGEA